MVKQSQTLAPLNSQRLERFLIELVNLRTGDSGAISRFAGQFAEAFGLYDPRQAIRTQPGDSRSPFRAAVETTLIPYFFDVFRAAWVEPDAKTREFAFAMLRTEWMQMRYPDRGLSLRDEGGIKRLPPPGKESPIEMAFDYLLRHHNRTRRCPNSECPAPYFFAARHTQRYCSEKCAQVGERETKRKWWAKHGADWRERTKRAASKRQRKATKKPKKGR